MFYLVQLNSELNHLQMYNACMIKLRWSAHSHSHEHTLSKHWNLDASFNNVYKWTASQHMQA